MIVYGKQISLYILDNYPNMIEEVYLQKEIDKKLFYRFSNVAKVVRVDPKKAQAMARGGNHQGFLLKIKDFELSSLKDIKEGDFILILYNVTDIGNIGAIVRTAYVFGVDAVVVTAQKHLNIESIIRASSGALMGMPLVLYPNALDLINELKMDGFSIYATDFKGENLKEVAFSKKRAVILGSEGSGIPEKILNRADKKISIKMVREFDSLNVSAAAAIVCDRIANG
ncbi:MAG: 23S rRNA (guanosine(2251)-2'-O)-methyltransferase RlmB [Epsilonproteobacteria bacterium]|nr:23S rRNA (guanosine(2251)-2'-O)-methyltransferase RlmB [Campylobacterota bacterium]